jgi:ribosomal protein S18 acetylase RimI-like enzyme
MAELWQPLEVMRSSAARSDRLLGFCKSPTLPSPAGEGINGDPPPLAGEGKVGALCGGLWFCACTVGHLCGYLQRMRTGRLAKSSNCAHIRRGRPADLDALWELENRVFATDRMSRRSLRRLLASPSAVAVVARADGAITGVAVVLFRANSGIARLYSLAVAPKHTGRGIASALLAAAEKIARSRKCQSLRLEVHEGNHGAIKVYRRMGYHEFGRYHHYYQDRGHALRFEKQLT